MYSSLSSTGEGASSQEELLREYFFAGYTYKEIVEILYRRHQIFLCVRQLGRLLRSLGLRRHRQREIDNNVVGAITQELEGSGSCLGYRSMSRRLLSRHGLTVPRHVVSELQRNIDPDGVAGRRRNNFSRRAYYNEGPNYLIHIDGYDKLKPYGFPIHGAICGFSRRVLWLNVANSNNNPSVVAAQFVDYIDEIKAVPRCVRMDAGTENTLVTDIQKAFRWDHGDEMAAEKSVLIGSSHSNQRIERWWLSNKQSGCQFWIDLFKDMEASGLFSSANQLHMECARFSFMDLLQTELDTFRMEWNQHQVRPTRQSDCPSGKPDLMFYLPDLFGTVDYKVTVCQEDIDAVKEHCQYPIERGSNEDVSAVLLDEMRERGLRRPTTPTEALELYANLLPILNQIGQ